MGLKTNLKILYALGKSVQSVIISNEPLPFLYNLLHCWSFLRDLLPTTLEKLPHLSGKTQHLSVLRHLWSTSTYNVENNCFIPLFLERNLTGEDLHRKHPKREHISSFRLRRRDFISFPSGGDDFWSQPPGGPNGSWGTGRDSETGVRVDGRQPVLRQTRITLAVNDDVCLSQQSQRDGIAKRRRS
jgi:hypothetical protein